MEKPTVIGPLARDLALKQEAQTEEFYNHNHGKGGKFAPGGGGGSGRGHASGGFTPEGRSLGSDKGANGSKVLAVNHPGEQGVSIKQGNVLVVKRAGLLRGPNAQLSSLVNDVTASVDSIHRVAQAKVTVAYAKNLAPGVGGFYNPRTRQIVINPRADLVSQKATLLHEFGHHMDYSMRLASVSNSALSRAWENSAAIKKLRDDPKIHPGFKSYATSHQEMFARSYAQWMATKTKDTATQASLAKRNEYGYQWEKKDFAPIAKEFDKMFKQYGVLK